MSRRGGAILAGVLAVVTLAASPNRAAADGTVYLGVGAGPAVNIDSWPTQFRLEFDVGYYFEAGPPGGFFLAFSPAASFSSNDFIFVFPLRLGGMFTVLRNNDTAFQLGPTGTVGFALSACDGPCDAKGWFHFSVAFMMRVLFASERVAFYVRPLDFEFAFSDYDASYWYGNAVRYVIVGGFQFHLD